MNLTYRCSQCHPLKVYVYRTITLVYLYNFETTVDVWYLVLHLCKMKRKIMIPCLKIHNDIVVDLIHDLRYRK